MRTCRECGCGEDHACVRPVETGDPQTVAIVNGQSFAGCSWVEPDLCSACAPAGMGRGWLHPAEQVRLAAPEAASRALLTRP